MTRYSPIELADALGVHRPTDEQAAVIAAPPGPLVVIAGAGAGKTETMAARVVWLVANGHADPPDRDADTGPHRHPDARADGYACPNSYAGAADRDAHPDEHARAAHGHARRDPSDLHVDGTKHPPEVECGRVTLHRWTRCYDHLGDGPIPQPLEEPPDP